MIKYCFTLFLLLWTAGCRRSAMQHEAPTSVAVLVSEVGYAGAVPSEALLSKSGSGASASEPSGVWGASGGQTIGVWSVGDSVASRATDTAFEVGDSVGLWAHKATPLALSSLHTPNMCYWTSNGTTWQAANALAGALPSAAWVTGYYPYRKSISDPLVVVHSVALDQSTLVKGWASSDFLSSDPVAITTPTTAPSVVLPFKHRLVKFAVEFVVPATVDGAAIVGVKSVAYTGFSTSGVVNLSTGAVSGLGNVKPIVPRSVGSSQVGGLARYEAVVFPQSFVKGTQLVAVTLSTTAGGEKKISYIVPSSGLSLVGGNRYSLAMSGSYELAFMNDVAFLDGTARTEELKIKVTSGQPWSLSNGGAAWLTLSTTSGGSYLASVSGTGTGAEQSVWVRAVANNSVGANNWKPRQTELLLKNTTSGATVGYTAVQNYLRFEALTELTNIAVTSAAQQVVAVPLFSSNQLWRAWFTPAGADQFAYRTGADIWGKGTIAQTYPSATTYHEGHLVANQKLYYQVGGNNTDGIRTFNATFQAYDLLGAAIPANKKEVTFTQPAPTLTLTPATVNLIFGATALSGQNIFTVTAPAGVKWSLDAVRTAGDISKWSFSPAVGAVQTGTGAQQQVKFSTPAAVGGDDNAGTVNVKYGRTKSLTEKSLAIGQLNQALLHVKYGTTRSHSATISHGLKISVTPQDDWVGVSKMGARRDITVTVIGASEWTAVVEGGDGVTVIPSTGENGTVATIRWSPNVSASVNSDRVIKFYPTGSPSFHTTIATSQEAGPAGVIMKGILWATGNLIADGANGCKIGAPTDCGLYFQFGSLIGWSGGAAATGYNGRGVPTQHTASIKVNPWNLHASHDPGATWPTGGSTSTLNKTYFSVTASPYLSQGTNIVPYAGSPTSGTGVDPTQTNLGAGRYAPMGVGDPCSFYLGSSWRVPNQADFLVFTGWGFGSNVWGLFPSRVAVTKQNSCWVFSYSGATIQGAISGARNSIAGYATYGIPNTYCRLPFWVTSNLSEQMRYIGYGDGGLSGVLADHGNANWCARTDGNTVRCVATP